MSLLDAYIKRLKQEDTPPLPKVETIETEPVSLIEKLKEAEIPYLLKEDIFSGYASHHRPHQILSIQSTIGNDRGQIVLPTGTGKTRVQIHLHIENMLCKIKKNETGVYVIAAHRLLLCKQLMDELQDLCLRIGIPINALYIGSSKHDEKDVYEAYYHHGVDRDTYRSAYTTSGTYVKKFYEETQDVGRHLIVVSTYHSFDKLKSIGDIDICTYDEAHVTTEVRFFNNIVSVFPQIKKNYFFTATRKVSGEDKGMNFRELYGGILSAVPPTEMIDAGEIIMPRIHIINLKDGPQGSISNRDEHMIAKTIQEAFIWHKGRLKEESAYPDLIGAKLLVSIRGSDEMELIQQNHDFINWCQENSIKTFSFSSEHGSYEDFIKKSNRNKVYESMRNLEDKQDAILFHIDILTEGVDLPSITGVLLLRHLNDVKLFQSLGRALRLLKADRKRLYEKSILPSQRNKFIKPYAYLILPMHFKEMDESSKTMMASIREVIDNYGIPTEEFLPPEEYDRLTDDYLNPITERDIIEKKKETYPLIHAIIEMAINRLKRSLPADKHERYNKLMDLFDKLEETKNA